MSNAYALLRRQNEALDERSQRCLEREGKGGSTHFSLTLINRMDPTGLKPDLKEEPEFGMGKVSSLSLSLSRLLSFTLMLLGIGERQLARGLVTGPRVDDRCVLRAPWR